MQIWQIISVTIVILFLPAIFFKFVDAKKLGEKLDSITEKIKAYDKKINGKG